MNLRILLLAIFSLAAQAAQAGEEAYIRGRLVWTHERQTVSECKTGRIYWVRVLASNPYDALSRKVAALAATGAESLVAELLGETQPGVPSAGPPYLVSGTLTVHQVLSLEAGRCED